MNSKNTTIAQDEHTGGWVVSWYGPQEYAFGASRSETLNVYGSLAAARTAYPYASVYRPRSAR